MRQGSESVGLRGAGSERVQGTRVQGVQKAQGCRECRGAGLKSARRSKSAGVQGSGMQGCRGLRDARGAVDKGAGLRGAETTGVYRVQKVQGSWGCRGNMGAGCQKVQDTGVQRAESAGVQRVQGCRAHECRGVREFRGAEAQGSRAPWLPLVAPSNF